MANPTRDELSEFAAWFEAHIAERFDAAIEHDAMRDALDRFADAALHEFREGKAREL